MRNAKLKPLSSQPSLRRRSEGWDKSFHRFDPDRKLITDGRTLLVRRHLNRVGVIKFGRSRLGRLVQSTDLSSVAKGWRNWSNALPERFTNVTREGWIVRNSRLRWDILIYRSTRGKVLRVPLDLHRDQLVRICVDGITRTKAVRLPVEGAGTLFDKRDHWAIMYFVGREPVSIVMSMLIRDDEFFLNGMT